MEREPPTRTAFFLALGVTALAGFEVPTASRADAVPEPVAVGGSTPAAEPVSREGPGFLRDSELTLRLRTYYADVRPPRGTLREAWALGGWLAYRTGWLGDHLQLGATAYGSAPLYDPADKADTLLLAPGGEGYYVLGEAFGALRFRQYAEVKAYRQLVDQPYVNPQDNAMTPNTFEGVTVAGTLATARYFAGYLTRMKTRNADAFVPMSEAAGARGSERGVAMLGVRLAPSPGLELQVSDQYGFDTFNTLFARAEQTWRVAGDLRVEVGAQLTDQRAVGDALVRSAGAREWTTRSASARVALGAGDLTLRAGASVTASGNAIQSPWGFYPGYLRRVQLLFDHAGERAWLAGASYDLSTAIARGLTASIDVARGVASVDPATGAGLPDEAEYDVSVIYLPPWRQLFRIRVIGVVIDQRGAERTGFQLRVTVNWELPVLRAAPGSEGAPGRDRRDGRDPRSGGPSAAARAADPR